MKNYVLLLTLVTSLLYTFPVLAFTPPANYSGTKSVEKPLSFKLPESADATRMKKCQPNTWKKGSGDSYLFCDDNNKYRPVRGQVVRMGQFEPKKNEFQTIGIIATEGIVVSCRKEGNSDGLNLNLDPGQAIRINDRTFICF